MASTTAPETRKPTADRATGRVWLKAALTWAVPFLVANCDLPVGTRRVVHA